MSDGFYRAFEDKHRGTLAKIKASQRVYLPFIQPLTLLYPGAQAIDLGCGRGEWLELLGETGFVAQGVDLDDGMLAECRARGLKVRTLDAISALKELPDSSQAIVSGFHLAEHIPFNALQLLVQEALRVLKPAGVLILETPNPENIVVGTANFYLDPTHSRPLPPLLLSFLPEYYGFARVKVLRLQEPLSLAMERRFTIHDVLGGISPDYAVVAQKTASLQILKQVSEAFNFEYGITLADISGRFERDLDDHVQTKVNELDIKLNLTIQRVDTEFRERMDEFQASLSPFIRIGNQIRLLRAQGFVARVKTVTKKFIRLLFGRCGRFISSRPKLKAMALNIAKKLGLYDRIIAAKRQSVRDLASEHLKYASEEELTQVLKELPPAVREVYRDLNIELHKQEKR